MKMIIKGKQNIFIYTVNYIDMKYYYTRENRNYSNFRLSMDYTIPDKDKQRADFEECMISIWKRRYYENDIK